jgi:hypothetical protein
MTIATTSTTCAQMETNNVQVRIGLLIVKASPAGLLRSTPGCERSSRGLSTTGLDVGETCSTFGAADARPTVVSAARRRDAVRGDT